VVELGSRPDMRLKDVAGLSGDVPVLDDGLIRSLTWASQHYVAPLPVLMAKASPPNLPRKVRTAEGAVSGDSGHPLIGISETSARGSKTPTTAIVDRWQDLDWLEAFWPVLAAERTAAVIAATAAEVEEISMPAGRHFGDRVISVPGEGDGAITRAWEEAQAGGRLVVGTPRVALWRMTHLALVVILEEGRRAMKDRQTPTLHVRDTMRTRSRVEGFNLVFLGPTPSVELLAAGASVVRSGRRPWGLVEVVDRSKESGGGLLSDQVMAALRSVVGAAGETAFILTGHKMTQRIADDVNRRLGRGAAAVCPEPGIISVGTERDLAALEPASLVVAADVDFLVSGTDYRASEEALRQLGRLGNVLRPGRGRRMMLQTRQPDSSLVKALRRGDPMPYLESVMVERARSGMPPSIEMLAIEVRGFQPEGIEKEVTDLPGVDVLGPMTLEEGRRWLVSGDLTKARKQLRLIVGRWRESGATVRIDADPIDL